MAARLLSWGFASTCISGEEIFMNNNDLYAQGCMIIKAWVEVILLEAIAQSPKNQPLWFWLQLVKY